MESKNEVTIVFSRDDDDRGEVIAVFDDKKLLDGFLMRPLASVRDMIFWKSRSIPALAMKYPRYCLLLLTQGKKTRIV